MKTNYLKILVLVMLVTAVGNVTAQPSQNVLVIIADDLGVDYLSVYGEGSDPAPTPNLDQLANEGVLFQNAWANPACSPTRAALLTGRYGFRTGVGAPVGGLSGRPGIPADEYTLPDALSDGQPAYANACIGKWHLADENNGGESNPNLMGFDFYTGLLAGQDNYFTWDKTTNGVTAVVSNYATTENVDDAIAWLDQVQGPWFQWLAFTNPHTPYHLPPVALHGFDDLPGTNRDIRQNPIPYFKASIEAMDIEIGRLLDYLRSTGQYDNTTIFFVGDNGTNSRVVQAPFDPDRAKITLYEGGVNVPLIVAGPAVVSGGRTSGALVHVIDIFSTSLELMGVDLEAVNPPGNIIDAQSFTPVLNNTSTGTREWVFTELFGLDEASNGKAMRNASWKLIRFDDGREEFYNLITDVFENNNLLTGTLSTAALNNYNALSGQLDQLLQSASSALLSNKGSTVDLHVAPNPADDFISLEVEEVGIASESYSYFVKDMLGVIVKNGHFNGRSFTVDLSDLESNKVYLVEIKTTSGQGTVTRILKR